MNTRELSAPAEVLRRRARRLAAPADPAAGRPTLPVLVFRAGGEGLALPLQELAEVAPFCGCTPVPGAPAALRGVLNSRGAIQPLFDLALLLGLEPAPSTGGHVLFLRGRRGHGLLVGAVAAIVRVDLTVLASPAADGGRRWLRGVLPDFGLLDFDLLAAALDAAANGSP